MHITFLAPAEAELFDAAAYYNTQREGLGYEFTAKSPLVSPKGGYRNLKSCWTAERAKK